MDQRIQFVASVVQADLRTPLQLRGLAESVNLSTSRLRHLFKVERGFTVLQYQRALRLEKSRALLATTFLSVKEIITLVGINSDSHFASDFKRTFGLTPTEYRGAANGKQ